MCRSRCWAIISHRRIRKRLHWRCPRPLSGCIVQPLPSTHSRHLQQACGKPQWPPRSMTHRLGNHVTDINDSASTKTVPLEEFIICPHFLYIKTVSKNPRKSEPPNPTSATILKLLSYNLYT